LTRTALLPVGRTAVQPASCSSSRLCRRLKEDGVFRGFNVVMHELPLADGWLEAGRRDSSAFSRRHHPRIEQFVNRQVIDGGDLRDDWFAPISAQVFISHSHADRESAWAFASFLRSVLRLRTFVDSGVWGYADDLLGEIDDNYCYNPDTGCYRYSARNRSTTHVHMMLATALAEMIDRCECILFLNTPSSITAKSSIKGTQTTSPWIFHELITSKLITKHPLDRRPKRFKTLDETVLAMDSQLPDVMYPAPLDHLSYLDEAGLSAWLRCGEEGADALDYLYASHARY
jgi:hypothetical protein